MDEEKTTPETTEEATVDGGAEVAENEEATTDNPEATTPSEEDETQEVPAEETPAA